MSTNLRIDNKTTIMQPSLPPFAVRQKLEVTSEDIFSASKGEIPSLIAKIFPRQDLKSEESFDFSTFINLLEQIFEEVEQEERTDEIINAMAEHPQFPQALNFAMLTNPKIFWTTIHALRDNPNTKLVEPLINFEEVQGFANFIQCVRYLVSSGEELRTHPSFYFEAITDCFDEDVMSRVALLLLRNLSFDELGKILCFINNKNTAKQFIPQCLQLCVEDSEYPKSLVKVVEAIAKSGLEEYFIVRPHFLVEFLKYEEGVKIARIILQNCTDMKMEHFIFLLWCLPKTELSTYLTYFPLQKGLIRAEWLTKLVELEESPSKRIELVEIFIKDITEEDLQSLLICLIEKNSPAIPYFCPAMNDGIFQIFSMVFEPQLRTNFLRLGLAQDVHCNRKIIKALEKNEIKPSMLCNVSVMDIVSQNVTQVIGEQVGTFATLLDFSNYIAEGMLAGDLEQKMVKLQKDFENIPPLMMALAMRQQDLRENFFAAIRYMSEEQFKAFVGQIPETHTNKILDRIFNIALTDQMQTALEELPLEIVENYLRSKRKQMEDLIEMITLRHQEIDGLAFKLLDPNQKDPETFSLDLVKACQLCTDQQGALNEIQSPFYLKIGKKAKELFDIVDHSDTNYLVRIQTILLLCKNYTEQLFGNNGLYKQLLSLNGAAASGTETDFNIQMIPNTFLVSHLITKQMLTERGLCYTADFNHLGIKCDSQFLENTDLELLLKYFNQEGNLQAIWHHFKRKNLGSIADLFNTMIVTSFQELFQLEELALKLGYKK